MDCQCETLVRLDGNEALQYAREHLREVRVDSVNRETHYLCPATGIAWQIDYPHSELPGGGPPRLRHVIRKASPFTRHGNTYVSAEGFSVTVLGRTGLLYEEGPRRLNVDSELLTGPSGIAVTSGSIRQWQPPYADKPLDMRRRLVIIDNIRRAFHFDGFDISIQWPEIARTFIPYDPSQGYPAGDDRFFECLFCGTIVPTLPGDNTGCPCGNLRIDVDYGRAMVRNHGHLRLFALDTLCQCYDVALFEGAAAQQYADQHLVQLRVDVDEGETTYRCAGTGHRWIMDHPHGELPGGGPPRLRRQ